MFLFNLSAAEFLTLLSGISSLVVVLYLLDRSRKRHIVPSLRFWQQTEMPSQRKHRRKIQQPWSLLLQLLGIALLLLAIAQLRLGSPDRSSRDHVLLFDASSWMAARNANGRLLLDEGRASAMRYIRALPSLDRVMLVRLDGLATPLTGFASSRGELETALRQVQPSPSALNLTAGLELAARVQQLEAKRRGEIVYIGAAQTTREALQEMPRLPENLRVIALPAVLDNSGLRKVGVRRSPADPELWQVLVTARNYGSRAKSLPLVALFGGAPVYSKRLDLPANAEASASFEFRTKAAGWIETRLDTGDALPSDDRATLELPIETRQKVVVYSGEPDLLRPVLAAFPRLDLTFRRPAEFRPEPGAILIFDRSLPPSPVTNPAVYIEPPAKGAPAAVRAEKEDAVLRWRADQPLAAGLRTRDARLERTQILAAGPGDLTVADVDGGPVIVAQPASKRVVFGFHPMRSALRNEIAGPLLFANVLKWMAPELFLRVEVQAGSVGTVSVPMEREADAAGLRLTGEDSKALPYTLRDGLLRFYAPTPGTVRLTVGERELVSSLNLPEVADAKWQPPAAVRTGFARAGGIEAAARDLWYWLALAGALVLAIEYLLFGRRSDSPPVQRGSVSAIPARGEQPQRRAS